MGQSQHDGLISVIMPCFNAESYLREAIESVLHQTYPNVELIVVDDGSTDQSRDILNAYGSRIKVLNQANQGPYPARNLGASHASGEYIAFLDADDWWSLDCLERLYSAFVTQPECDLAYCGWQNVGAMDRSNEPFVPPNYQEPENLVRLLRGGSPWPIHAALVRKSLLDLLDGFSERRYSSMDYDFWLRALAQTRRIVRVPEVLAFYRWHGPNQVSAVKWRQVLDALEVQRQFIRANPSLVAHLSPAQLKDLTEGQVLRQAYRALWKRDLVSAQKLFRHAAAAGACKPSDLRHIISAMLPMPVYRRLIDYVDGGGADR